MYKCSFCGYSFNIIGKYNTHLYLHRFYGGRTPFKCLYNNCFLQFKRYSAFHTHVVRSHPKKKTKLCLYLTLKMVPITFTGAILLKAVLIPNVLKYLNCTFTNT